MKALIIDDERPARAELRRLLKAHTEIQIIGEAENVTTALEMNARLGPDLIFLDIQMPRQSGFDFVAQLPTPIPHIIFTTTFNQYAVRAFEVNATDYLLKPVDPVRLAQSLARLGSSAGEADEEAQTTALKLSDRVLLRSTDRTFFIPVDAIRLLESVGNYTKVFFGSEAPMIYRSLAALEVRLPAPPFFRANRSQMINTKYIENLEDYFAGGICVTLLKGEKIDISRRRAVEFWRYSAL
jgi:two-component system, LytTR family, response regulator